MKPVLMIHEFHESFFDLPLEDFILTFDDGLYTQYIFFEELKKINTKKYFFISGGIVCPENITQDTEFITCEEAHRRAFNGDYRNYMKWSQIKEINNTPACEIGYHGFSHCKNNVNSLLLLLRDTKKMIKIFNQNNLYPRAFCFPYNIETPQYREILRKASVEQFFGSNRIDILTLLKKDVYV